MWDKFDLWLFEQVKNVIQKNYPFTQWYMDGEPIGWYMFWLMAAALIGQGIVVVVAETNKKGGRKK